MSSAREEIDRIIGSAFPGGSIIGVAGHASEGGATSRDLTKLAEAIRALAGRLDALEANR